MKIFQTGNLGKNWGGETVLEGIEVSIHPGEKVGLIGRNGCGKTTLLEILSGGDKDYSGSLVFGREYRIAYVSQYLKTDIDETVESFLLGEIYSLRTQLEELETVMSTAADEDLDRVLSEYQSVRDEYDKRAGDTAESRADRFLENAGLAGKNKALLKTLSGGECNILGLLRAMVSMPDLIMLDEPGNHLDYRGLAWLESFLKEQRCAVLLVSHNRYLLDRVVDRIWEIRDCHLTVFRGNYSAFRLNSLKNMAAAGRDYKADQKKIRRIEELVRRFEEAARNTGNPAWGQRLKARRTQLARIKEEATDKPETDRAAFELNFNNQVSQADIAVSVSDYSKNFGDRILFQETSLFIRTGERVALIGPNGSGKSTFLKDLIKTGEWNNPVIRVGPSMIIGYCAQNQEVFDPARKIAEEFEILAPGRRDDVFRFLSKFLFSWDDMERTIGTLSGGEKNRLQIARALYLQANFLVLDEPTNHLDIPSREAIENGLEDFRGTLLVVSHDRYFLDKAADRVIEISDQKFEEYDGNFSEFWAYRRNLESLEAGRLDRRAEVLRKKPLDKDSGKKTSDIQRAGELEKRIMNYEEMQKQLERDINRAFSSGDYSKGGSLARELEQVVSMLNKAYEEWSDT